MNHDFVIISTFDTLEMSIPILFNIHSVETIGLSLFICW